MVLSTFLNGSMLSFDCSVPIDISLPITESNATNAFHLPPATFTPFRIGDFVGSIEEGGPVRCDVVQIAPHGNGTHTECIGHIAGRNYSLVQHLVQQLVVAQLITIDLSKNQSVTRTALESAWSPDGSKALIVRTLPNANDKRSKQWSGNNPQYVEPDAIQLMVERGVQHLLVDLPSVDPEEDGGALASHHVFWAWPDAPRAQCTITELIYVANEVPDGRYLLSFNAAAFDGDAAPSRPTLYPEMVQRDETMLPYATADRNRRSSDIGSAH